MVKNRQALDVLFDRYVSAREVVINSGFGLEVDWQASRDVLQVQEPEFLREAAWVILNSGMRESVVRKRFIGIDDAFMGFSSAESIVNNRDRCVSEAMKVFGHRKKIGAILGVAFRVALDGFHSVRATLVHYGVAYLRTFDYLGPATSNHLAKNLGMDVSKPDRHLLRIADATGYLTVTDLCVALSELTGDSQAVVDLVMWRFATLRRDYVSWFNLDAKVSVGLKPAG